MATTYNLPIPSSPPAWILLDFQVCIGDASHRNDSTAVEARSNGRPIEVSVWAARPPTPSRLYVHCPDLEAGEVFLQQPCIVNTEDGFVLLRLAVGCPSSSFSISSRSARIRREISDYFIYRPAGPEGPLLKRIQKPPTRFFKNYEVALLPRGDHFTLAALSTRIGNEFDLHLFKSENGSWDTVVVVLEKPQEPVPENACQPIEQHITSTVITIGGEGGTIGWVDLWRGILLCDLLTEKHNLRYVPMPPPNLENHAERIECCPKPYRSIAAIGNSLRVVELEVHGDRLPYNDPETGGPNFRFHDWTLTTYTKSKSENNSTWDWVIDCTVKASDIKIKETVRSALLRCGHFCKPQNSEAAECNLQNLYTCQPVLGLDDKGIVYLIMRFKFLHPKAWILAVDMRNNSVQAMIKIASKRSKDFLLAYCGSRISSYMNATKPGRERCPGKQLQRADVVDESTAASSLSEGSVMH
jgi:hypothetical protein